jgi:hypothetical protein
VIAFSGKASYLLTKVQDTKFFTNKQAVQVQLVTPQIWGGKRNKSKSSQNFWTQIYQIHADKKRRESVLL